MSPAPKKPAAALMKAAEVKQFLGIGNTTLHRWCKSGSFPRPRILPGGHRRWARAEVEEWAAQLPTEREP